MKQRVYLRLVKICSLEDARPESCLKKKKGKIWNLNSEVQRTETKKDCQNIISTDLE